MTIKKALHIILVLAYLSAAVTPNAQSQACSTSELEIVTASDGAPAAHFGRSLDVSGATMVVGAPFASAVTSADGVAYVFVRSGEYWQSVVKLIAADSSLLDQFGSSVAISGDVIVVGAPYADANSHDSGSAYVFERLLGNWYQTAKLAPSDLTDGSHFGYSVSASGERLLIGSPGSGTAYVYKKSGATWAVESKLTGPGLGVNVDASGETVIASSASTYYFFQHQGSSWSLVSSQYVGSVQSISVDGSTAAVRSGASVQVFSNLGYANTISPPSPSITFKSTISVFENRIAVSGRDSSTPNLSQVYIYDKTPSGWSLSIVLHKSETNVYIDSFTSALAMTDELVVVGAEDEGETTSIAGNGAAFIFPASPNFAFVPRGSGCPGAGGFAPHLAVSGCSIPGGTVNLGVDHGTGGAITAIGFGLTPISQPLGGGCSLLIDPVFPNVILLPLFGSGPGQGAIAISAPLPIAISTPLTVEIQAFVQDPTPPKGFTTTNAVRMTIYAP